MAAVVEVWIGVGCCQKLVEQSSQSSPPFATTGNINTGHSGIIGKVWDVRGNELTAGHLGSYRPVYNSAMDSEPLPRARFSSKRMISAKPTDAR